MITLFGVSYAWNAPEMLLGTGVALVVFLMLFLILRATGRESARSLVDLPMRLETIDKEQANIEKLSGNGLSLQDILPEKLARGAFGEIQLNDVVGNALSSDAFPLQATLSDGKRADFLRQEQEAWRAYSCDFSALYHLRRDGGSGYDALAPKGGRCGTAGQIPREGQGWVCGEGLDRRFGPAAKDIAVIKISSDRAGKPAWQLDNFDSGDLAAVPLATARIAA